MPSNRIRVARESDLLQLDALLVKPRFAQRTVVMVVPLKRPDRFSAYSVKVADQHNADAEKDQCQHCGAPPDANTQQLVLTRSQVEACVPGKSP